MSEITAPSGMFISIVPVDDTPLPTPVRALYIGTAGDLTVYSSTTSPNTVLFKSVPAGVFPIRPEGIQATGTTAADIVGLL